MGTETTSLMVHPQGEQPEVEAWAAVADTYAGRVHVEWDATAPVTPFGQLPDLGLLKGLCGVPKPLVTRRPPNSVWPCCI